MSEDGNEKKSEEEVLLYFVVEHEKDVVFLLNLFHCINQSLTFSHCHRG